MNLIVDELPDIDDERTKNDYEFDNIGYGIIWKSFSVDILCIKKEILLLRLAKYSTLKLAENNLTKFFIL